MNLALEILAPCVAVAVLILTAQVRTHVLEKLVLSECELGNHIVELSDGWQLALEVDRRLE